MEDEHALNLKHSKSPPFSSSEDSSTSTSQEITYTKEIIIEKKPLNPKTIEKTPKGTYLPDQRGNHTKSPRSTSKRPKLNEGSKEKIKGNRVGIEKKDEGVLKRVPLLDEYSESFDTNSEEERKTILERRKARRMQLIRELVKSEETHVESLQNVIVNYLSPLKEKKILPPQQIKNLFGNIELILTWNMNFLSMLRERLGTSDCFGDLVVNMSVILRQLFTQYNENYHLAQKTYTECLKNYKEFEQFIQQKNQASSKSNLLTSLYLPIQRMIMYDSLLKDIVVLTPQNHHDYDGLCTAYKLMRSMDKAANRVVEKRKNLDMVIKIQNSLNGDVYIAQPHRSYVFEEMLLLSVGKAQKERILYLFNDILLLAKPKKKNKCGVEAMIPLDKLIVDELDEDRHLFKITEEGGQEYILYSDDKASWIQLLQSTKKKLHILPPEVSDLRVEAEEHAEAQKEGYFKKDLIENGEMLTKKMLMKKIIKWNEMKNPDQILREIKKMAKRIEKYEQMQQNVDDKL